ncbi:MAG: PKD domain-containing protein, partial [Pyrinomonadaceae bacterium]
IGGNWNPGPAAPATVDLQDTSTGAPTAWLWLFGDGTHATTQNPSHTYDTPGTYKIWLNARNNDGTSWKSLDITVTAPPAPTTVDPTWLQWDRRCIMSYSRTEYGELEEYFCGKCILRNRGWKVQTIGYPGPDVREP